MKLDGFGADPESRRNHLVRQAISDQLEHLAFARGERLYQRCVSHLRCQQHVSTKLRGGQSAGGDCWRFADNQDIVRQLQAKLLSPRRRPHQHDAHTIKDAARAKPVSKCSILRPAGHSYLHFARLSTVQRADLDLLADQVTGESVEQILC